MKLLEDNSDDWKGWERRWKGRQLEGLEGALDTDADWKGRWIRTPIGRVGYRRRLEGLEWKGRWIGRDVVDGRIGYERRLEGLDTDFDWKGWIRTLIGRVGVEGTSD